MTVWKLPCAFNARSQALVLRACLDHLDYLYETEQSTRHFAKFTFIITLDRFAYSFRFEVSEPEDFYIESWDESPGHGGEMHFLEVSFNDPLSQAAVTELLKLFAATMPRPPWKFTMGQKLSLGLLQPEILRARKRWSQAGVTLEGLKNVEPLKLENNTESGPLDEAEKEEGRKSGDGSDLSIPERMDHEKASEEVPPKVSKEDQLADEPQGEIETKEYPEREA